MGSVGNPNPWATYDNFKDCSQAVCSIYCPQFCYLIFPPPPPSDDDSSSSLSPLIIAVIGVLATGLLLVSYYIILSRYCKRRGDHNIVVGTDEVRGETGNDSGEIPSNGLDESLIKNITVFKYQKSGGSVEVSDCAVCLSEFQENESLRLLPKCSHAFHLPCIDTWLKSHSNCPLCRAGVVVVAHPTAPPEAGTLSSAAVSASPFEVHRPNDLTLVVDDQECFEQVVVSLQNDQEMNTESDQETEQFRRSVSLGTFSCGRHLLISDVLKIEEDLEFGGVEHWKSIGSSNGFGFKGSESSPVDAKRSISAEDVQSSGFLQYPSSNIRQSTSFINIYTPKVIGIYMEPSVEYIVAVLSVLRCGEAFMPLDPAWPKSRIISVISSSKAKLVIGCKSLMQEDNCHKLDKIQWLIDNGSFPVLPISMEENLREQYQPPLVAWPCESESLRSFCYLMYTSGSSGKPKGVCGTELGLLNRFTWMQDLYPVEEGDLVLFKTQISFIDHLPEFLGAILANCTLVTPPFNQLKENILCVIDFLQGYFINKLVAVPSLIRAILPDLQSPRYVMLQNSMKLLILSGEVFHVSLCEMLMKLLPQTSILNLYGSTEVTGDCTYFDCKRLVLVMQNQALASIPIGLPLSNCDVVLVGEDAPLEGEIYVGGPCVAAGYYEYPYIMPLEQMKLPLHCDVQCPGDGHRTQNFFKTGDFARKLPSGDLVFLGRKDRTMKINGQRVALEEIEGAFRDHPDVVDAAVICHDVDGEILLLEAYLLLKQMIEETEELKSSLRSWMMSKLPQMMIPSSILFTRSLPLTSSGKVDYSSLAASTHSVIRINNNVEEVPPGDLLDVIQKVFSDAIMVEKIAVDDNFFDMGGNSMSAAYASFKLGIHMKLLYTFPTPLKLQMALLSSDDALRINSDSGVGLSELHEDMFLSNYNVSSYPGSKSRARLLWSDSDADTDNPSKHLKVTKEGSHSDDSFWNLNPPVHTTCSFSRCNKGSHGGNLEENCLCYSSWSNMLVKDKKGFLQELWKTCIDSCVDASPLVVFLGNDIRLFIGSHSHKFVCLDAKSGNVCWETKLQGRVECSAEILDDFSQVVVGCYEGKIYFLDYLNGSICWKFQTSGEVKSQPLVDKCSHLVWCGSYDQNLYALDYKSYQCIYKLQCGGSIFGSPAIDEMQRKLFVAATSGHVTAVTIQALPFKKLWKQDLGAPIFGSLSIISSHGNVICCLVDGTVVVLNTYGFIIWKARAGGPIFAGPCISKALPSQVLVSCRDGSIYSFEMETGNLLWNHNIGHPISSSPCADEDLQLITDVSTMSECLICVCDSSGCIHVLRIDLNALGYSNRNEKDVVREFARLDLEGEIFSSPVMIGGRIFVGCRDDHVYCIKLDVETIT